MAQQILFLAALAGSPLIRCAKRLDLRPANDCLAAAPSRDTSAAFAHFLGNTNKSIYFQRLGWLLPDLSTSHPQSSPSPLWTNRVFGPARPLRRGAARNKPACPFFRQWIGLPLESMTYETSQAPFHKPSTVLSRCIVESRGERCACAQKRGLKAWQPSPRHVPDAPQPAPGAFAQNLSSTCFTLYDQ
ncbi:hypothetical protein CBM2606_A30359 [Cupriavidus taiwanensis]|nr:hypothetical protein CBM2606_A30359 [Cupriavidus taiwanensis]